MTESTDSTDGSEVRDARDVREARAARGAADGAGRPRNRGPQPGREAEPAPDGRRLALTVRRERAVRAAVARGLIGEHAPVLGLLDVTGIREDARALHAAFAAATAPGAPVLHAFAVKAAPLVPVLELLRQEGLGAEVASPGELALARAAGVEPARIVLDSPAKTRAELREALDLGIAVNVDNPQELARLDALLDGRRPRSPLGVRVNPQVGGGSIEALSTATATSKFGVALRDEGARDWLVRAFLDRPWLTRLHTHTGSQGIPLGLLAAGLAETCALAEEINHKAGRRQIDTLDIGGGLPVNFHSDDRTPDFADYARLLRREVPALFDGGYGLVTEFGRALLAKHGTALARVEYTKTAGGRPIAVTHAGAQIAARTVYAPGSWPLRIAAYDGEGRPKTGPAVAQDVAGPACFAGDLLARDRALPLLEPGDHTAALDTGAYYFAHHYAYNSLARPAIYGFVVEDAEVGEGARTGAGDETDDGAGVRFAPVREQQGTAEIVAEGGGGLRGALTELEGVDR